MSVIHPYIFEILRKLPDQRENILNLHSNCYTFRALCEDLRKCEEACQYWDQSGSQKAKERSEEYRELRVSLESELLQFIKDNSRGFRKRHKQTR